MEKQETSIDIHSKFKEADTSVSESLFKSYKLRELIAIACRYTGSDKNTYGVPPLKSSRVQALLSRHPKTCPFSVCELVTEIISRVRNRPLEALDVSSAVVGRTFHTATVAEADVGVVITKKRDLAKLNDIPRTEPCPMNVIPQLKPKVMCQYGVAYSNKTAEERRKERVSAICDALVVPSKSRGTLVAASTSDPVNFQRLSVSRASRTLASYFHGDTATNFTKNAIFHAMQGKDRTHAGIAQVVGQMFQDTVYAGSTNSTTKSLEEVACPPAQQSYEDPSATILELVPTIQPKGVGRVSANMFDGVMVSRELRTRMNKYADIVVPDDATIVYINTTDKEIARQVQRGHRDKKRLVFYKVGSWINNQAQLEDYVKYPTEKNAHMFEHGEKYRIVKSGVIPWFGKFVSIDPDVTLYVDVNKVSAPGITAKKLEEGCRNLVAQERWRFSQIPNAKYFLMSTHVFALHEPLYVDNATDLPKYGKHFRVSRAFATCNVLNANFLTAEAHSFTRAEICQVFIHVLRRAMSYPVTRSVLTTYRLGTQDVQIVPWLTTYPFSIKPDIEIAKEEDLKRRTVVPVSYEYGVPPQGGSPATSSAPPSKLPPRSVVNLGDIMATAQQADVSNEGYLSSSDEEESI